jgi:hypothetical protein
LDALKNVFGGDDETGGAQNIEHLIQSFIQQYSEQRTSADDFKDDVEPGEEQEEGQGASDIGGRLIRSDASNQDSDTPLSPRASLLRGSMPPPTPLSRSNSKSSTHSAGSNAYDNKDEDEFIYTRNLRNFMTSFRSCYPVHVPRY